MNEPASGISACAGSLGAARPSKARDASNEKRVEWGGGAKALSLDSFIHVHRLVRLRVFFLLSFRLVDWCLFAFGEEQAFVAQKARRFVGFGSSRRGLRWWVSRRVCML